MSKPRKKHLAPEVELQKCLTGIQGFDEITEGGIPRNRITLLCGSTGTGKTLLGVDFLINGAIRYNEPGVFMSFEETEDELYKDVASLTFNLRGLVVEKKILIDYVLLERKDIKEAGEFNLEGLFVRLELAIDSINAKRVVLDSIESLFAGVTDVGILRLEIKRLFRWLKDKKVTALITGEVQQGAFTRRVWRNTFPTASSWWTTASGNKLQLGEFVSSNIAAPTTEPTNIRSSSIKMGFRSSPSPLQAWTNRAQPNG